MGERLRGRVAIVTGAGRSNGIGAAVVRRFCQEGARVLATDILDADATATYAGLRGAGHTVDFRRLDVTDENDWNEAVEHCRTELGSPSILVNNAGMYNPRLVHEETPEEWRRTIDVNLTSVFLGMRAVIPLMLEHGGGAIVNTSSMWGLIASEANAAYHASKGGVTLLTKHAGSAYAKQGIRVNSVHPGGVQTTMIEETGQANQDAVIERAPMGRLGEPHEIAEAVVFLASDEAAYVTGAGLLVDGGFTAI